MKLTLKKEVFKKLNPRLKIVFLLVEKIDNTSKLKEAEHLLHEIEKYSQLLFNKETIKNHHLIQPWAVAKAEFGAVAKHYHTSVEKLLTLVLKKKTIATKDTLTTLLRYIALKHIVPFGVDDLDTLKGDLTFTTVTGKEKGFSLHGTPVGALYYHDESTILGKRLDFWKNSKTALTKKTSSALIHFPILPPLTDKMMKEMIKETKELIDSFCGGKVKVVILDKVHPSGEL